MKKRKHIKQSALAGAILLILLHLPAIVSGEGKKALMLCTDRNFYMAGEELYFAAQGADGKQILYLEFVDVQGNALVQKKYRMENGRTSGMLQLPTQMQSGTYVLRAYTGSMNRNKPEHFSCVPLLLIHPESSFQQGETAGMPIPSRAPVERTLLLVEGLKDQYTSGDSIQLWLKANHPGGAIGPAHFSLSLVQAGTAFPANSLVGIITGNQPDQENGVARGISLVSGRALKSNDLPLADELILLSPVGEPTRLYSASTNRQGEFVAAMELQRENVDLLIQAPQTQDKHLFTLDQGFSSFAKPPPKLLMPPPDSLERIFGELYVNARLEQIYRNNRGASSLNALNESSELQHFYGEADRVLLMEEYIKLPIMEEVFRELGKRVFLERRNGELQVRLLDLKSNRIIGERPWFFLDGVPFFDSGKLLALKPADIHSIRLKSERYFLGDLIMDGIIDIHTHRSDASLLELPPYALREYFSGLAPGGVAPPHPSFSTTAAFMPNFCPDPHEGSRIVLPAPRRSGAHELLIYGFDGEGRPAFQRVPIHVR